MNEINANESRNSRLFRCLVLFCCCQRKPSIKRTFFFGFSAFFFSKGGPDASEDADDNETTARGRRLHANPTVNNQKQRYNVIIEVTPVLHTRTHKTCRTTHAHNVKQITRRIHKIKENTKKKNKQKNKRQSHHGCRGRRSRNDEDGARKPSKTR